LPEVSTLRITVRRTKRHVGTSQQEKNLMTKLTIVAFAALSILATAIPAKAGTTCRTSCSGFGASRVCTTNCN
jgi:hypothetical protein